MYIVIIAFLIAASVLFYWYLTITYDYWKKRNVVFEKPYPFVGTAGKSFRLQCHPGVMVQEIYNKHPNEKLIGAFASRRPALIIKDPDIIKNVLVKDFNYFVDREITVKAKWEPLTQQLLLEEGDLWRGLRQKLTPTFTSGKIRNMFPLLDEVSKDFQEYLKDITRQTNMCDVKELSAKFTTDIIGSCVFGIKTNALKDDHSPFRIMGRKMFRPTLSRLFSYGISQMFPRLFKLFKMRITTIEMEDFFINLVKSVMQSRDYKPSSRHDFIDQLIQLKTNRYIQLENITDRTNYNVEISDELLAAQAFSYFGAGFETSSNSIALTFYELAKNQEIQMKLIEEIDIVLERYDRKISFESLKEMTYLKMVVYETLRLYPPLPVLNRVCTKPCTLTDTDIKLDKGVAIAIPVYAMQRDPKFFPDPEKFLPERFTDEAKAERHPFIYMPFGEGPRACIGYRFAMMQTTMGILSVLENHKVDVNKETVPNIRISPISFTLCSKDAIYLTITKRTFN